MKKKKLTKKDVVLKRSYTLSRSCIEMLEDLINDANELNFSLGQRPISESKMVERAINFLYATEGFSEPKKQMSQTRKEGLKKK